MRIRFAYLLVLSAVLISGFANAFEVPALTGPVVDQANLLDARVESAISDAARSLVSQGGSQIQVLTVKSLNGVPIEQASIQVTDKWKLGLQKTDRGVLLLVSAEDRAVRIEVGQGNEGDLTDAASKRIVEDVVIPYFKQGDFNTGIAAGFVQIAQKTDPKIDVSSFFDGSRRGQFTRSNSRGQGGLSTWFFIILFLILIFNGMFRPPGRRRGFYGGGWGGGLGGGGFGGGGFGGGGGSWGGGGGGFSGGGASGRW